MPSYDVLIVGNGILGLSIAYALAQEDASLSIAIMGKNHRQDSATLAAGAMLGCFSEVSQLSLHTQAGLAKFHIARSAKQLWSPWLAKLNSQLPEKYQVTLGLGTHLILNARSGKLDDRRFKFILEALHQFKEPYEKIAWSDIPGLSPIDDCRPFHTLYLPNEGYIDPQALITALEYTLRQHPQVTFIDDHAHTIHTSKHKISHIVSHGGNQISAHQTILAAGAYTQTLLDQLPDLASRIPRILSGVGCAVHLKHKEPLAKGVIRTPNRAGACGLHAITHASGDTYIGASNFLAYAPETEPRVQYQHYLLQYAMEQINQQFCRASIKGWSIGNRPIPLDTYPLIGPTASISNLWLATGNYRDGLHASPFISDALAKQFLNVNANTLNPIFYPERAPIQWANKENAISEFVYQAISTAYEHSMRLPNVGWNTIFPEMMRCNIESLYQELDINYGLPVEVLLFLDRNRERIPEFRKYYQRYATQCLPT